LPSAVRSALKAILGSLPPPAAAALLALPFLVFLAFCLRVAVAGPEARRRRARDLIAYALFSSAACFLAGTNAWPISGWTIVPHPVHPETWMDELVVVDDAGGEHPVDARALEPLMLWDLTDYLARSGTLLTPEERATASAYLVEKARVALARLEAGQPIGTFDRVLGPLAAPCWSMQPHAWRDPGARPRRPLVGVRVYRTSWNVMARAADPSRFERTLLHAWP
jgi:hypothetical protein